MDTGVFQLPDQDDNEFHGNKNDLNMGAMFPPAKDSPFSTFNFQQLSEFEISVCLMIAGKLLIIAFLWNTFYFSLVTIGGFVLAIDL